MTNDKPTPQPMGDFRLGDMHSIGLAFRCTPSAGVVFRFFSVIYTGFPFVTFGLRDGLAGTLDMLDLCMYISAVIS
jgi:hypothetical protein